MNEHMISQDSNPTLVSESLTTAPAMARRSYRQFYGLTPALDIVGERWTLLIVRELATGPKRYSDLTSALRGIGTNLLATRIKRLESDHVLCRRLLDPTSSVVVYELTDIGQDLAYATVPLAVWGARHYMNDGVRTADSYKPEWLLTLIAGQMHRPAHIDRPFECEFRIDDTVARIRIGDSDRAEIIHETTRSEPDVTLTLGSTTAAALVGGRLTLDDALKDGHLTTAGDPSTCASLLHDWEHQLVNQLETIRVRQ